MNIATFQTEDTVQVRVNLVTTYEYVWIDEDDGMVHRKNITSKEARELLQGAMYDPDELPEIK